MKSVTVVLTQAGASSQSGIDQAIDSIVDHNVLSLNGIAQFLLSSPNERSVILMEAFSRVKKSCKPQIGVSISAVQLLFPHCCHQFITLAEVI